MDVKPALLVLCIALLAPTREVPSSQEAGSFMLAVLRRDGVVVPFAAFNGKRWSERWPDRPPREVPVSLDDVPASWWGIEPAPARMHRWTDGVRAGDVALTGLTFTTLMCQPRLALRSDYKSATPVPPRFVLPYPKDGLLVAGDVPVEKIPVVDPRGAEARMVLALATAEFNRQENIAAGAFTSWRHPVKADQRKRIPITMEALYRAPADDPGGSVYFMEAVRQFPPGPTDTDNCGLATYVNGWIMAGADGRTRVRLTAAVTYCDRKGVGYMLPFGVIRADGRSYWVFQYSGFEGESYEVVHPSSRGIESEVVYTAGTCG
jgi:hypothetical protein